jgi:hypothetical protein
VTGDRFALASGICKDLLRHALVQPYCLTHAFDSVAVIEAEGVDAGAQGVRNLAADDGSRAVSSGNHFMSGLYILKHTNLTENLTLLAPGQG